MTDKRRYWSIDDIPWDRFDPARVDPDMLRVVKAAAMVEFNGGAYADYLCNVFNDDVPFQEAARRWAKEEIQHGSALSRWAKLADPEFDFDARFADFTAKVTLPTKSTKSVRGSRCGELVARCMVEVGTSSYYTALGEGCNEPVLREICRLIAQDEIRHYKLFYTHMARYRDIENLGFFRRLMVGLSRIGESEDDELAYAYYAANNTGEPYERNACFNAYMSRIYHYCRPHHVERSITLMFRAVGITPHSKIISWAARLACRYLNFRAQRHATATN